MKRFKYYSIIIGILLIFSAFLTFFLTSYTPKNAQADSNKIVPGYVIETFEQYEEEYVPTFVNPALPAADGDLHYAFPVGTPRNSLTGIYKDPVDENNMILRMGGGYNATAEDQDWFSSKFLPKENFKNKFTFAFDMYLPQNFHGLSEMFIYNVTPGNESTAWRPFKIGGHNGVTKIMPFAWQHEYPIPVKGFNETVLPIKQWFKIIVEADMEAMQYDIFLIVDDAGGEKECINVAENIAFNNLAIKATGISFHRVISWLDIVPEGTDKKPSSILLDNLYIAPEANVPRVDNVAVEGKGRVGNTVTGRYDYYGTCQESESVYQWYSATPEKGKSANELEYNVIQGATEKEYKITENDVGKYLRFEVVPKHLLGTGLAVRSENYLSVTSEVYNLANIESGTLFFVEKTGFELSNESNDYLQLIPSSENATFSLKNAAVYQQFNSTFEYSIKIKLDKALGRDDVLSSKVYIGNESVEIFKIQNGQYIQGDNCFDIPKEQWLTVRVVFASERYYATEIIQETQRIFTGTTQKIQDEAIVELFKNSGVSGLDLTYVAKSSESASISLKTLNVKEASNYFLLLGADIVDFPIRDNFEHSFQYLSDIDQFGNIEFSLSSGNIPEGISISNNIAGVPTESGEFDFVIKAITGNYESSASFSMNVLDYVLVSFETFGGEEIDPVSVLSKQPLNMYDIPEYENHRFLGWYTEKECENFFNLETDRVYSGMTLYAKWLQAVELEFDVNGGNSLEKVYVYPGDKLEEIVPVWEKHRFLGWYTDSTLTNNWDIEEDIIPDENFTLYASWLESVKITYVVGGGESISEEYVYPGDLLQEKIAVWEGHVFRQWFKNSDFIEAWDFNSDFIPNEDFIIYAQWDVKTYQITFISSQGHESVFQNVKHGEKIVAPQLSSVNGYKLIGWYADINFNGEAWNFNDAVNGDMRLYAKFEKTENKKGCGSSIKGNCFLCIFIVGLSTGVIILKRKNKQRY